jgi:hypothetical protein
MPAGISTRFRMTKLRMKRISFEIESVWEPEPEPLPALRLTRPGGSAPRLTWERLVSAA